MYPYKHTQTQIIKDKSPTVSSKIPSNWDKMKSIFLVECQGSEQRRENVLFFFPRPYAK